MSALWDQGKIVEGLNTIDWSSDTIQDLENTVTNGLSLVYCASVSYNLKSAKFRYISPSWFLSYNS